MPELAELTKENRIRLCQHRGQWQAWNSEKRFIGVLAGTQGGKTSWGPHWLLREIQRRGPGDYLVVTPTYQLLEKKALPEFIRLFETWLRLGKYKTSPVRKFTFDKPGCLRTFGHYNADTPTTVFFGYADDPESLESATAKAAWLDEAGQKRFKLGSWEAILRRLSIAMGRALITTTPYDLGWLKQVVYDRWKAGSPDYDVVRFDSTENPNFPQEEFERARRDLPPWKFNLFYRGIFTRPAGQIYDSFIHEPLPKGHLSPRWNLPVNWPRHVGLDFGGVNTAAVYFAEEIIEKPPERRPDPRGFHIVRAPEPGETHQGTGRLFLYRTYKAGGLTAKDHAAAIRWGEPHITNCVGGSHSEGQWRAEFRAGGLCVMAPPIKDVEVGINRVYGAHARNEIVVFDDLAEYLEQKSTYSRKLNQYGEPTEEIEDKATFHYLDAERYIISALRGGTVEAGAF